jgi:hypothetical protein
MMVGSIAVGVWIARAVLAILILEAVVQERFRVAAIAVVVVMAGWLVLGRVNAALVTPFVAIVDIALVLAVHGRDIRLN